VRSRVLIADDDRLVREVLRDLLEEGGFAVLEAGDGDEACRIAAVEQPDAIVLDLVMPSLDGLTACRRLRANPEFRHTPILLLTARADLQESVNPFLAGADDYLTKPFDGWELLARLRGNLAKQRLIEARRSPAGESASPHLDRAALERELKRLAIFEQIFENASEGLAAIAPDGEVVFANRRALEIVGYQRSDLAGRTAWQLLGRASSVRVLRSVRALPQATGLLKGRFDAEIRTASGEIRRLSVGLSQRQIADRLAIVAIRDVTEKRRTEQELQQTKATLEEANRRLAELDRMRAEFLNTATHELRIPVTIVHGYCSLFRELGIDNLNSRQKEFLAAAYESSEKLVDLVNKMLDISRYQAGRMNLELAEADLSNAIFEVCRDLRPMAEQGGVQLSCEYRGPSFANFDQETIQRVLINLVGNAIKFTPEGGRINVRLRELLNEVRVCIEDSGKGIPGDRIDHVFEEFTQLDRNDARRGSGLGLAISKKIVEAHGGRIWVESAPGSGSRFSFSLPKNS